MGRSRRPEPRGWWAAVRNLGSTNRRQRERDRRRGEAYRRRRIASTDRTNPPPAIASTTTRSCSIPMPRRSAGRFAGATRCSAIASVIPAKISCRRTQPRSHAGSRRTETERSHRPDLRSRETLHKPGQPFSAAPEARLGKESLEVLAHHLVQHGVFRTAAHIRAPRPPKTLRTARRPWRHQAHAAPPSMDSAGVRTVADSHGCQAVVQMPSCAS